MTNYNTVVVSSCQNDDSPLDYFQNIIPSGSHDMVTELNNVSLSNNIHEKLSINESSPKIFHSMLTGVSFKAVQFSNAVILIPSSIFLF